MYYFSETKGNVFIYTRTLFYIKYLFYNGGVKYVHKDTNKKQEVKWGKRCEKLYKGADFFLSHRQKVITKNYIIF